MRRSVDRLLAKRIVHFRVKAEPNPLPLRRLPSHPDQDNVCFLVKGIEEGFHIGVDPDRVFKSAKKNMLSAEQNSKGGNIVGPFSPATAPKVHTNRFGTIPKRHQPGKWHFITDLSYPNKV